VINGDVTQIDLPPGKRSGLVEAREILSDIPVIAFVHFNDGDIVRHPLVAEIIRAYQSRHVERTPADPAKAAERVEPSPVGEAARDSPGQERGSD